MNKIVLIINGRGGCGKDTLVGFLSEKYKVQNESAIDPSKAAGMLIGYTGGKSDLDRSFLSELKALSIKYYDHPMKYLKQKFMEFLDSDNEILFLHIREKSEIERFLEWSGKDFTRTLLVQSGWTKDRTYGNPSDDEVESMPYDFVYVNSNGKRTSKKAFLDYFENVIVPDISEKQKTVCC